jgi:1,2-diacylglycerol 3-alpha-glucosyltransferase
MKIGIFTDSYRPYTSGVVRSIDTFAAELTAMGHEIYIFAPNYPDCEPETGIFRFFSIPAPTQKEFSLAIPFALTMGTTIRQLGLDLIHVHSPFLLGRLGARCAKRYNLPLVFTYHTLYDKYIHYVPWLQTLSRSLMQQFIRNFCNNCDTVIVPTDIVAQMLKEQDIGTPLLTIPTGIDLAAFARAEPRWLRNRYGIADQEQILLFVGRLGQEKNLEFLLHAFKKILHQLPQTRLVLVGSGSEAETFRTLAITLGMDKHVIFTGNLPYQEVINCYADADLFVFASVTETQGLVIGEAQAAGLPVVAVDAYGVSEMVHNNVDGYLTPLDPEAFTDKILAILTNASLRTELAQNARQSATRASSQQMALKLADAYTHLVAQKKQQNNRKATG